MRSEKSESIRDLDLLAASDSMIQAMSERLAEAVKIAGGRPAVVAKTGITNTTLWRLLKGQQPKHAYMVAIAKAAGVSLDWLTTGNGPKMATDSEQEIAPPPASRGRVLTLEMADISALSALVERAGGIEQAAEALKLPPEELRAIIASGRAAAHTVKAAERLLHLPHLPNDPATPSEPHPNAPPEGVSIWHLADFDVLLRCLEFVEGLDRLGGGQLRSAKSRMIRALNAYDLHQLDKD